MSGVLAYTPNLWFFIVAAIIQYGLAVYAWQQRSTPLGRAFFRLMVLVLVWTAGFVVELAAQTLELKVWLSRVEFVGIVFLPLAWLDMACAFAGKRLPRRLWLLLALPSILTLALVWLVPSPNWFWGPLALNLSVLPYPTLAPHYNFWFYSVHAASGYLYLVLAVIILLRSLPVLQPVYRRQAVLVLVAMLLPAGNDVVYVLGFQPIRGLNFTTAIFGLSGVLVAWALYRYRFLDLAPLARDLVIDKLGDAILVIDDRGRFVDFNPAARQVAQFSADSAGKLIEAIPTPLLQVISDLRRRGVEQADIETGQGRKTHFEVRLTPVCSRDGQALGQVITLHDITERVELLRQMRELATHDSLTGVCTRRHFMELGQRELERLDRHPDRGLSVAVLDLDNFKRINDTWGHAAGDQSLVALADLCSQHTRANDLLGRMGGDEFAILFPEMSPEGAAAVAERIRSGLERLRMATADGEIAITASLGIASLRPGEPRPASLDQLLSLADRALYQAKHAGRNRVEAAPDYNSPYAYSGNE